MECSCQVEGFPDQRCAVVGMCGRPRIKTEFWRKPGPTNKHDWLAFWEGDEPNDAGCMAHGHGEGATEAEAIADLIENSNAPECR